MFGKRFNILPINVIVIGCGGTGSRVIPFIAQYMSTLPEILSPTLTLIDGDDVEAKNLSRQNFIEEDVGLMKSDVLASRYGDAYGVNVLSIAKFYNMVPDVEISKNVSAENAWDIFLQSSLNERNVEGSIISLIINRPQIIISCVDNVVARMNIINDIANFHYAGRGGRTRKGWSEKGLLSGGITDCVIIDAGNENTYGQVRIFNPVFGFDNSRKGVRNMCFEALGKVIYDEGVALKDSNAFVPVPFLPIPFGDYAKSLVTASAADRSCADLDQTMAVNIQMAVGIFQMYQNLAMNHVFKYHTWYYDLHNGNSQERIDINYLKAAFQHGGNRNAYNPIGFSGFGYDSKCFESDSLKESDPNIKAYANLSAGLQSTFKLINFGSDYPGIYHSATVVDVISDEIDSLLEDGVLEKIDPNILAIIRGTPVKVEEVVPKKKPKKS